MAKKLKLINLSIAKEFNQLYKAIDSLKYISDINIAYGEHLDFIAFLFGLTRKTEETDVELKKRIGKVEIENGKQVKYGKIASNCSQAGRDDLIQVTEGILNIDEITTEEQRGSVTIIIPQGQLDSTLSVEEESELLTEQQVQLIKVATPAGIRLYLIYLPDNYFGFYGDSEADTFGDYDNDDVGGYFCELIGDK